jgi:hypothetical protein
MAEKSLGIIKVKIAGAYHNTITDSVTFDPGGFETEEMMADGNVHYREKPRGSRLSCKFLYTAETKLKAMNDLRNDTLELETDIGITLSMTGATRMGEPPKVDSSDGTVTFEAFGDRIVLPQ